MNKAVLLLALIFAVACAPLDSGQQRSGKVVTIDKVSNDEFEIVSATLFWEGGDLVVVGKTKPYFNYGSFPTPWTHIDVIAYDPGGNLIKGVATRIFPIGSGPTRQPSALWTWSFATRLGDMPSSISSVWIVAQHGLMKADQYEKKP